MTPNNRIDPALDCSAIRELIPEYAFGAIKGKDNISNAKKHQGKKYIFTTDLTNFFPSVSHNQVFEMFVSVDFSPTVARCLTEFFRRKLPGSAVPGVRTDLDCGLLSRFYT